MVSPKVSKLRIYPIKSLDPVELKAAEVGVSSLLHDREFAMLAQDGRFVNGKRTGRVNELKTSYDLQSYTVHLSSRTGEQVGSFRLMNEQQPLEAYLSAFFGEPISFVQNKTGQLMDIPEESAVTLTSQETFESLQKDLHDQSLENLRLRFRANIELDGAEAFWEEANLLGKPGTGIQFSIGDVEMVGISPRARCNVPPRDPLTGITDKSFIKQMMKSRSNSLSPKSHILEFGSLYQLTINVHVPISQNGKWIHLGDPLKIYGPVDLKEVFE